MRLIACGTAGGPMTAERAASGYLVEHKGRRLMLDCGPGALRQAMRLGISPADIEAVALSHLHLDHALDLATWAYLLRYNGMWPTPAIYGPPGTKDFVQQVAAFGEPNNRPSPFTSITEIECADEREVAGLVMRSEETRHAPNLRAYARRLEAEGRSLVYTGDTSANPEVIARLARGTDLLVHECYSRDGFNRYVAGRDEPLRKRAEEAFAAGHCLVGDAALNAREVGAARLCLTHLLATEEPHALLTEACSAFAGEVLVAQDGMVVDL